MTVRFREYPRASLRCWDLPDRAALVAAAGILAATDLTLAGHSPVAWLLVVYALAGHATAIQRFVVAYRDLRS
ncbi:MAG: hypothetical protein ABEJ86_00845 [Halococcoides sp.]